MFSPLLFSFFAKFIFQFISLLTPSFLFFFLFSYSYALVQYGNFLCQRNIALVGQMFLDRGGQAAGKEGAINALTGKQVSFSFLFPYFPLFSFVFFFFFFFFFFNLFFSFFFQVGGAVMVYFPDGTKKTVGATPATSSVDLMESLQAIFLKTKGKSAKPADIEVCFLFFLCSFFYFSYSLLLLKLINAQFRVLVLHERTKERERPMKDTEKPWLLLQKPGNLENLLRQIHIH